VFEPGENEKWIRVEKYIIIEDKVVDRDAGRAKLAYTRTKDYLISCGYKIEEEESETLTPKKTYLATRDSPARIHNGHLLGCHSY